MPVNVLENIPSFKLIISTCPQIRTGTFRFKQSIICYSIELITIIAKRHYFNHKEAIAQFKFGNTSKLDSIELDYKSISTFRELMNRQDELLNATESQKEAVLEYSHSITWALAYKYKFPGKLYEDETFTRTDPTFGRVDQLEMEIKQLEDELKERDDIDNLKM